MDLGTLSRQLRAETAAEAVVLFGSRARGDAGPGSDYDLLVVTPTAGDLVAACAYELSDGEVNVIVRSPSQVRRSLEDLTGLVATIASDGEVLSGRAPWVDGRPVDPVGRRLAAAEWRARRAESLLETATRLFGGPGQTASLEPLLCSHLYLVVAATGWAQLGRHTNMRRCGELEGIVSTTTALTLQVASGPCGWIEPGRPGEVLDAYRELLALTAEGSANLELAQRIASSSSSAKVSGSPISRRWAA